MAFPGALELFHTLLYLLYFLASTSCQCQDGNANTETGKALIGATFNSFTVMTYLECLTKCVSSTGCRSLNFIMTNTTCELNSETKTTRPDLYVRREKCIYTTKLASHAELVEMRVSTTQSPTAQSPSTQTATAQETILETMTTQSSVGQPTTTQSSTTQPKTTGIPTTQPPTTEASTLLTTIQSTTTGIPTTEPTTQPPTTEASTLLPTTQPTTTGKLTTKQMTTDLPITEPTTLSPTTQSTTTQAAQVSYPRSCLEILRRGISTGDGEYSIDPNNAGVPIRAYCDMATDGGGWTIVKRTIFQTSTPPQNQRFQTYEVISEFNTNNLNIYPTSKAFLDIKNTMGFHQIHFYCQKQSVGRVISIRTRNDTVGHQVVRYFTDDEFSLTNFVAACGSFDRLPDDTSVLGQNCAKWNEDTGTWGRVSGSSRTLASAFFIKDANTFGCNVSPPKVEYCACDDARLAPLPYNPQDRWQISVR